MIFPNDDYTTNLWILPFEHDLGLNSRHRTLLPASYNESPVSAESKGISQCSNGANILNTEDVSYDFVFKTNGSGYHGIQILGGANSPSSGACVRITGYNESFQLRVRLTPDTTYTGISKREINVISIYIDKTTSNYAYIYINNKLHLTLDLSTKSYTIYLIDII